MPTNAQRIDRIEAALERLTGATEAIAASVAAHDDQIEKLIEISEANAREWQQLRKEWQAYLNTIRPQ
jgi:hypothetical protein